MKILQLVQGTPEWYKHRAGHLNASDAPAMLGISPYKTRTQLLNELATGVAPEIGAAQQRRFDDGHRFEALARPIAEEIIGEELFPCVGVTDDDRHSASFDGLTLLGDAGFEHKSLNDDLRAIASGNELDMARLPDYYRAQMEQQCMVSGATCILFMASKWDGDRLVEEVHGWYYPDQAMRDRIVSGWDQFARDFATHKPAAAVAPAPTGRAPETLPVLRVEAQGMVTFSNLDQFRTDAMAVLGSINRDLQTDEDFADAETTVKWCKGVEDRLDAAKANVLAQMQSVDEVCRTIDSVSAETRKVRLELDRLVKAEKEHRRTEMVNAGVATVREHYATINATLAEYALGVPTLLTTDIGAAIKGKKTITSIRDAVDTAVAAAKIEASQRAEKVRACVATLDAFKDHAHLFADRVTLCATKSPEDLRNLATARIAEHQRREEERLEAERARIRAEEQAKAEREERLRQQGIAEAERVRQQEIDRLAREQAAAELAEAKASPEGADLSPGAQALYEAEGSQRFTYAHPGVAKSVPAAPAAPIRLGDINASIAPLSISAAGLAGLGFAPIGTDRAAKLYAAESLPAIYRALLTVIERQVSPLSAPDYRRRAS